MIQPLPGIGDMVWHLPHIRAIASHFGGPITLVTKPRSAADQIFAAEDTVSDVLWLDRNPAAERGDHDGPAGLLRLIAALRSRRFKRAVLLHHSRTLAFVLAAAGIPERHGYGYGLQRPFLNRPPTLPGPALRLHPFEQATVWLAAAGIPMAEPEPILPVLPQAQRLVRERLGAVKPGLVVLGIGSSEPYKQWGASRFAELAVGLTDSGWGPIALAGGPGEGGLAQDIAARAGPGVPILPAIGWPLAELAALCAEAAFYVGNDTGVMNLAAAVGTRSYGLFGAVAPFHHATRLVPLLPPHGRTDKADGMARISVPMVLETIRGDRGQPRPVLHTASASVA